ncbi:MAG: RNA polymerase sigma factor [Polyangiaceae bacterium]
MTVAAHDPPAMQLGSLGAGLAERSRGGTEPRRGALAPAAPRPCDPERFAAVARDHIGFVWRVLRRQGLSQADADDGVQRVFLVFREKGPRVAPGAEKGFLFRVARFVASELRRGARRFTDLGADFDEAAGTGGATERSPAARIEAAELLEKIMRDLDDDEATVFALFEIEGLLMVEIASLLECPVGTVASRLRRAREKVRAAAAKMEPGDGGDS